MQICVRQFLLLFRFCCVLHVWYIRRSHHCYYTPFSISAFMLYVYEYVFWRLKCFYFVFFSLFERRNRNVARKLLGRANGMSYGNWTWIQKSHRLMYYVLCMCTFLRFFKSYCKYTNIRILAFRHETSISMMTQNVFAHTADSCLSFVYLYYFGSVKRYIVLIRWRTNDLFKEKKRKKYSPFSFYQILFIFFQFFSLSCSFATS